MKTAVEIGWPVGLGLLLIGLVTYLVLDIRSDSTGKEPSPVGTIIALAGVLVIAVMLCLPASYQPL